MASLLDMGANVNWRSSDCGGGDTALLAAVRPQRSCCPRAQLSRIALASLAYAQRSRSGTAATRAAPPSAAAPQQQPSQDGGFDDDFDERNRADG